jgi:L-lactate utilization protein LutC
MSREAFLARVREAAHAGLAYRVHVAELPGRVGYCGAGDHPPARLAAEVEAVGGKPRLVDDWPDARSAVETLLDEYSPASALCWKHLALEKLGLASLLDSLGIAQLDYDSVLNVEPSERRNRMLAAGVGISSATYAIAETGSLAMASGPGTERVASLLPPVHIAIVSAEQILPDLFDLFERMQSSNDKASTDMPSNWTLITGPSKTGDLELKLTTGVHGPGKWHVIIVRSPITSSVGSVHAR